MRIAILNSQGVGVGGATRAARRLRAGLRLRGHEALMISPAPDHDPEGIGLEPSAPGESRNPLAVRANRLLENGYINPRRTAVSNTLFSAEVAGYSFADCDALKAFDIINIHWVPSFVVAHNLEGILGMGKPVVLTLHDMAAFTGGCHYSAGCGRYREECSPCPQLADDILQLTRWTLGTKRRLLQYDNLFAVAPSRWLATCASASGMFQPGNIETIPNSIETQVFVPHEKAFAKAALGIDPGVQTLLCGAENHREHRKGLDLLIAMLEQLKSHPPMVPMIRDQHIRVLVFGEGEGAAELRGSGFPFQSLGVVRDDAELAIAYSAADLSILPSREDNLPNIVLESMACGTPIVAFGVGGIPEIIQHAVDGCVVPPFDISNMASAVADLLTAGDKRTAMGQAARDKMAATYTLDAQAEAYEALFENQQARMGQRAATERGQRAVRPATWALPITTHPEIGMAPLGLFLEQEARIDELRQANEDAAYERQRVLDVLTTAVREAVSSASWRFTRALRRGASDPEPSSRSTPEMAAVALLAILRSKSWELTAPLRALGRTIDAVVRIVRRPPRGGA